MVFDCVHERLVDSKNAIKLEKPLMYNCDGNVMVDSSEMVGGPTYYELVAYNGEYVIITVDKTGCNTNQKSDGPVANEKMIVNCNGISGLVVDAHYTTLVFQSVSGILVCCAVIMKSKAPAEEMHINWHTGIDVTKARDIAQLGPNEDISTLAREMCRGGPVRGFCK